MSGSSKIECVRIGDRELEAQYLRPASSHAAQSPIVLLHEALGSISHWRSFPERLGERTGRDVLVYSRAGHGWSEGPPEPRSRRYYEQQALEVLPAMLRHFRIERPVLMGHSEGAAIALIYVAKLKPSAVEPAAHEIATHPALAVGNMAGHQATDAAPEKHAASALILESPIIISEPASAAGMALAERAWQETDLQVRLARHHRDAESVFRAWLSIRDAESLLGPPLTAVLPMLNVPILLLQGEHDEYATALQIEALRPIAPRLQVELLAGIGHTPHREAPELVLDRIAAFLQEV